jgi:uncharacterized membrane protein YeaQ/YmgE (transglycosylase-associated protein family)
MGMILEIVLNNFSIAGKSFFASFRAIEFMRKWRADFFNFISKNHGLTRTFSSHLRGLVSLSLVQGHALFWGVTDTATHGASIARAGHRPKRLDTAKPAGLVRACCGEDRPHPDRLGYTYGEFPMHIIWTIIIGFIAGVIAKFVTPGENEPSGFVLTTILGILGAFLATYLGQAIGWYRADEGAGLIGAVVGAIIILVIWGFVAGRRRQSP